jgi:hypothetical protein
MFAAFGGDLDQLRKRRRGQAGALTGPAHPRGDHRGHGVAILLVEHHLGRHPVEQEPLDLGRADPQRLAVVIVGTEVHQQPRAVPRRIAVGQTTSMQGGEELVDDRIPFRLADLPVRLACPVGLGHRPAAGQRQRSALPQLLAHLWLPRGIGRRQTVLHQPPRFGRVDLLEGGQRLRQRRFAQLPQRADRFRGDEQVLDPAAETVEVHQRHQSMPAAPIVEHHQHARLVAVHVRQAPALAHPHPADLTRPRRLRHAGCGQSRRSGRSRLALLGRDTDHRQRPQQRQRLPRTRTRRVVDHAQPEDDLRILARRQPLPPRAQQIGGEHLHLQRVGRLGQRSKGPQHLGVQALEAIQTRVGPRGPRSRRRATRRRLLPLASTADWAHRPILSASQAHFATDPN